MANIKSVDILRLMIMYFFTFKCLCKRGFTALTSTDKYYLLHVFVISQTVNLRVLSA